MLLHLVMRNGRQIKDTTQLQVTGLLHAQRLQQSLSYLANHEFGALLGQLHEAVLDDVVDEEIYVTGNAFLIGQLFDRLLDQVRLCVHEVTNVIDHFRVQLIICLLLLWRNLVRLCLRHYLLRLG